MQAFLMKPETPSLPTISALSLAFAALLCSCASDSGFAKVRNPFSEQAAEISEWVEERKAPDLPEQEDVSYMAPEPERPASGYRYFGR